MEPMGPLIPNGMDIHGIDGSHGTHGIHQDLTPSFDSQTRM